MDWLQFVASVVGSLAWPAVLLVGFFIVRDNLGAFFPFIERLKYKDFEVQFRKSMQEIAERSRSALPIQDTDERETPARDRLYSLAEISPRSAILEAWLQVEAAAADALQSRDPSFQERKSAMSPIRLGEKLNDLRIIDSAQLEIFHRLRELRNKAIHVGDAVFHSTEVAEYITLSASLASKIKRVIFSPLPNPKSVNS